MVLTCSYPKPPLLEGAPIGGYPPEGVYRCTTDWGTIEDVTPGQVISSQDPIRKYPTWLVCYVWHRHTSGLYTHVKFSYMTFKSETHARRIAIAIGHDIITNPTTFLAQFPMTNEEETEVAATDAIRLQKEHEYKERQKLTRRTIELMFPSLGASPPEDTVHNNILENAELMGSLFR